MKIDAKRVIAHPDPAWRADANFMVQCRLDAHGVPGWFEQIWTKRIDDGYHQVCCIPFFLYGVALGDVVTVDADGFLSGVYRPSGRAAVRILAKNKTAPDVHEAMHDVVVPLGALAEWQSAAYVAIDAADHAAVERITAALQPLISSGHYSSETSGGEYLQYPSSPR